MHPTSILLALASAALIRAIAIPQPAPEPSTYDTCLDQYAELFELEIAAGAPPAGIAECTSCAGEAVADGFLVYVLGGGDLPAAKSEYTETMAKCRGDTGDDQYNTCLNEYGTIFEFAPTSEIATCTGCAGRAVGLAFAEYIWNGVAAAKGVYKTEMEKCRDAE